MGPKKSVFSARSQGKWDNWPVLKKLLKRGRESQVEVILDGIVSPYQIYDLQNLKDEPYAETGLYHMLQSVPSSFALKKPPWKLNSEHWTTAPGNIELGSHETLVTIFSSIYHRYIFCMFFVCVSFHLKTPYLLYTVDSLEACLTHTFSAFSLLKVHHNLLAHRNDLVPFYTLKSPSKKHNLVSKVKKTPV